MRAAGGADELSLKGQASMDRSLPFTGARVLDDVCPCGTCRRFPLPWKKDMQREQVPVVGRVSGE